MSTAILSCLSFDGVKVRVLGTPEAPEWVAADVGEVLGIAEVRSTIRDFEPDERGVHSVHGSAGAREMLTVTEPGLYRLIFISRKPEAAKFRRWVFHEVLPQIRRTGSYAVAPTDLEERVARLEQNTLAARVTTLEAKLGQLPLFLEEAEKPKRNVRASLRAKEVLRNAAREERIQRLVRTWGEEFGNEFTPLFEARRRSQRIADLANELGDEVRHLLREANTRGLVEGQHDNKRNTKAWRPATAAERN